jgi:alkylation response protein AidB-like acyl-CoA dehydrogenase
MSFMRLTPEQNELHDATARFLAERSPLADVRQAVEAGEPAREQFLRSAAELGWYAPFVPEHLGGGSVSDAPWVDAMVVAVERGRTLQRGPFAETQVVAYAVAAFGSDEQQKLVLPELASGQAFATWLAAGPSGTWGVPSVTATADGAGYRLSGAAEYVGCAQYARYLLVPALTDGGPAQFLVRADSAGVSVDPVSSFDVTAELCAVSLHEVYVDEGMRLPDTTPVTEQLSRQLRVAALLTVGDAIGAMEQLADMATAYSKDRYAFGRQIGSFQALKHLLADMSMFVQASKACTAAAVEALGQDLPDADEVVHIAKSFVSDTAYDVAQGALQVHGGIGYAWEHDLHLYLRRLAADSARYGDAAFHRELICQLHAL